MKPALPAKPDVEAAVDDEGEIEKLVVIEVGYGGGDAANGSPGGTKGILTAQRERTLPIIEVDVDVPALNGECSDVHASVVVKVANG